MRRFALVLGLLGLLVRRICVSRVRYISAPSDYLMLLLILAIAITGMMMRFVAPTDVAAVKAFAMGPCCIQLGAAAAGRIPALASVAGGDLMCVLPFSKLLHAPGLFFSPTRNQVDDARSRRHLADWAAKLERH